MAKPSSKVNKGEMAEEALREYFSEIGSFAIRSIPVQSGGEDVTDIDLWTYSRVSPHSRNIAIIDIKNKKRGKSFERAIWVKGLQSVIGANEAIIATQGAKTSVYEFADRLGVRVISSSIFDSIVKRYTNNQARLAAEEVEGLWEEVLVGQSNLKSRMHTVKAGFSSKMNFTTLNRWVDEASSMLRLAVEREREPGPITRAAYLCCALVGIAADYLGHHHSLSNSEIRRDFFQKGLTFGNTDKSVADNYMKFSETLVTEYLDPSGAAASKIRSSFDKAVEESPMEGLVEYFSRPNVSTDLYNGAIQLEKACYSRNLQYPADLQSNQAKIIIGLIADFAGIARKDILGERTSSLLNIVSTNSGELLD